ncbi:MAG TPA: hypothetical protein VJZ00_04685, partial [Thermoanaerobaculia bacterium]|nr:hypothetical protein [Thermoanaerobaculia bacterium]
DPGVIVPVTPSAAENTTTLTPAESARERRYNELLRTPPPPAPGATPVVPPPVVPPPAKERPPANREPVAVKPKPQPQPQATPPPPPQQQPPAPTNSSYPGPSSNSGRGGNDDNDDPDTDLIAPQLLGADFQPPQVQDGDTTVFAVLAQDNLSGVRTVSGVIANPTGNVQGFACQREGDSNRYVTRISVPKDAAAGTWVVKYLTLTDNASNSVNLNASQGALPPTASFRVVASASDTTAPALKAVWVDRAAMRAGDKNTLFVQADDEQTGVSSVNGVFVSPGKQARLAFGCGKNGSGTWECALTPPSCLDCGVWHLEQLQLQDKANNMATIRADNPLVRPVVVDISGDACDSSPPALSTLSLNPLVVSNVEGGTIEVRAVIADDGCGVASLSGQAIPQGGVGGQHAYFTLAPSGDGRTFVGKLEVQKHAAKGTWTIAWLQALDKGHNLRAYAASDPIIARVTFRVE